MRAQNRRMGKVAPKVRIKRIYDDPAPDDGARVLVDRLWPRGISKERAELEEWCKQVAPSTELRKWYSHDPAKFAEFGKRYKDWLFARAEQGHDWLAMVEAGASMLLRDAVREQLRREHAPKFMVSLQQPMGEGLQGTCTLEELIPDQVSPTDSTTDWEWQQLALTHAQRCYPTLTETEKLVLWARDQGYTLNDPQLAERGKVSMNVLYRTYRSVVTRISLELKAAYPGESPASLIQLARLVLEQIALRLNSENFCQKDPSGFLMEVE